MFAVDFETAMFGIVLIIIGMIIIWAIRRSGQVGRMQETGSMGGKTKMCPTCLGSKTIDLGSVGGTGGLGGIRNRQPCVTCRGTGKVKS